MTLKGAPIDQLRQDLASLPPEHHLPAVQAYTRRIADPEERAFAESLFLLGLELPQPPSQKHLVVLIHGIRTHAVWQESLASKLDSIGSIETFPIGYGFLEVLSFLLPGKTREDPIARVARELRTLREKYGNAKISVVAHSFGTYIISRILSEETDIGIYRLQLCGSIIPEKYRWDKVSYRISGVVVNDAGTRDYWPVMASISTWGYGATGTFGFKKASVKDRFHNCGHSDFFNDEHMDKYWVPLLVDGQVVPSTWTPSRRFSWPISLLNRLPLKTGLGIFLLWLSLWRFLPV